MNTNAPQIFHVSSSGRAGDLIAEVLASAWRVTPDSPTFSETDLVAVTPQLYRTGDAGLAWWRIRNSSLAATPLGQQFCDAYKHLRLAARVHEREIKHVISLLRAEGIEPVLVKGWAIARRYPDPALRPYGDIDLCVAPNRFAQAQRLLKELGEREGHHVDLHDGFTKLEGVRPASRVRAFVRAFIGTKDATKVDAAKTFAKTFDWDELFGRSQLVDLGDLKVRVLCDEDHLRLLCLHLLRSGAWRPLWLCDVALLLETIQGPKSNVQSHDFNWDICLGQDRLHANWVASAIALTHELLGVDISETPFAHKRLPRWLSPAVLRQWSRSVNPDTLTPALPSLLGQLTRPLQLISELKQRLDHPVRATARMRGQFNNWPRQPYQLAELILRSREIPKQLSMTVRQRHLNKSKVLVSPTSDLMMNLTSDL